MLWKVWNYFLVNNELGHNIKEEPKSLYLAVPLTAEVNTSDLRSFLIQCGRCARVVHVHRREIKRLASVKAYFGLFLEKKKMYLHISNCYSQRICWLLSGQASQQTNHPECDTQGTSSAIDEDCLIGGIFIDLSKAFALAGHKLPLQNFKNVGPCRDCIKCFALTWRIVQERKPHEHRFKGITNGMPEGIFYFLCLTIILQSNVFSPLRTCMLMI